MDCFLGMKKSSRCEKGVRELAEKIRLLQEEIKAIVGEREVESKAYERDMVLFAFREAEWKQERKKLKEEVKRLGEIVEEKEEKIRGMEDDLAVERTDECDTKYSYFVEQMRQERVWRDEAVDKWKKLYLAINTELDDLIQRTHPVLVQDGLCLKAEVEDMIEELKTEVKTREETIEELKARIALVKHEDYKKERKIDILRQSLRIISSKKTSNLVSRKPRLALVKYSGIA